MGEFEDANKFNDATRFGEGMKAVKGWYLQQIYKNRGNFSYERRGK